MNGRAGDRAKRQIDAVLEVSPDVIALQEITTGTELLWRDRLQRADYFVESTVDLLAVPYPPRPYSSPPFPPRPFNNDIRRKYANLIAARGPISRLPGLSFADEPSLAWPEKHLAASVTIDGRPTWIHNAHLPPGSSRGLLKMYAFEAICARLEADVGHPTVLCGDFNAPLKETAERPEYVDRTAWREHAARFRDAEASVIEHKWLRDAYVHKPGQSFPVTHFTRGETPHRYDHIFVSRELEVTGCKHTSEWLRDGLSDHAAVLVTIEVRPWLA